MTIQQDALGTRRLFHARAIASVLAALFALAVIFLAYLSRGQNRIFDRPFEDIERYLSAGFNQDLRVIGFRGFSGITNFLAEGVDYAVDVREYVPDQRLRFEARMGQIGNEVMAFRVVKLDETRTEVSIDGFATLFLSFSFCRDAEAELLERMGRDLTSQQ